MERVGRESVCVREREGGRGERETERERERERQSERDRESEEVTSKGRDRVTRVWVYHSF